MSMLQVMVGSRAIVFNLTSENKESTHAISEFPSSKAIVFKLTSENKETTHAISEFPKVQDFMDPEAHTESILTMNQTFRTEKKYK